MRRIARIRNRVFAWGARTYLMGIVNATPDSFSGDGRTRAEDAIAHALTQLEQGADILDIGAQSTRPGHTPLDAQEERRRLLPVVRGVRERAPEAVISIDTYDAGVFRDAHEAGGDILNSIWGVSQTLLEAAISCDAPVVLMHNKAEPSYQRGVVEEVLASLEEQAACAVRAGLLPERVILDPGIGFGKLPEHNVALLASLDRLAALGFSSLVGASRKSTLGALTGRPVGERMFATAATVALAVAAGVDIVRVHDVGPMRDVVRVADAVKRGWRPEGWAPGGSQLAGAGPA